MSEKNQLQELCQKNGLDIPAYQTWSGGKQHELEWYASVAVNLEGKNITVSTKAPAHSKLSAEKRAATLMVAHMKKNAGPLLRKLPGPKKWENETGGAGDNGTSARRNREPIEVSHGLVGNIYLLDLENKPCFGNSFGQQNAIYIGFLNSIHHSVGKYHNWHECKTDDIGSELDSGKNNRLLYLIDGGTADLADHLMTLATYPLVNYLLRTGARPKITIVSGDHAGWCTRACLEKVMQWRGLDGAEICNSNGLE